MAELLDEYYFLIVPFHSCSSFHHSFRAPTEGCIEDLQILAQYPNLCFRLQFTSLIFAMKQAHERAGFTYNRCLMFFGFYVTNVSFFPSFSETN